MMLGLASVMMEGEDLYGINGTRRVKKTLSEEERKRKEYLADIERKKNQGLTEFFYRNGNSLWALNQKSANKKAKKKGWI